MDGQSDMRFKEKNIEQIYKLFTSITVTINEALKLGSNFLK